MLWFRRWFERSGIHCPIRHVGRAIQMRAMPHCLYASLPALIFFFNLYCLSGNLHPSATSFLKRHSFFSVHQVGVCNLQWACREDSKRDDCHLLSTGIKPLSLSRLGYLYKLPPCIFAPLSPLLLGPLNGRKFGSSCIIELLET